MALVGNLKDLKLPNLIQINCMEKNVAKLVIEYRNKYGTIFFADGQIVHAEYDKIVGEKAVFALLSVKEGIFKVENGAVAPQVSIQNSWSNILLEGMRQIDESSDDLGNIADNTIDELINIRGINNAIIFSSTGEIIAKSTDFDDSLIPYFNYAIYKTSTIQSILGSGTSNGIVFNIGQKYYFTEIGKHFLVLLLEEKSQIDLILPRITSLINHRAGDL